MTARATWPRARAHLRRRRLDIFVVGHGKSGTTSLAAMFDEYRSGHEVGAARLIPLATDALEGRRSPESARVRAELRRRHLRYKLEVDSAAFLTPFAGTLAEMYPRARFVLPIRDCFSWLDSQIDWQQGFTPAPGTLRYDRRRALFDHTGFVHAPEEAELRQLGVLPVAAYLQSWVDVNTGALDALPAERTLVVRTEDLDESVPRLAAFAGVPSSSVHPAHANRNETRSHVVGRLPRAFVVAQAQARCSTLMERFWGPGWETLAARIPQARD